MVHKVITGLTLLAFVNSLMGCIVSSVDRVSGEETVKISPTEKITELVMLDGSTVNFDERGGKFSALPREVIRGRTVSGDSVSMPLSDAWQCRTSPPDTISRANLDTSHIFEVVLDQNSLVMFQPPGGTYDPTTHEITGSHAIRGKVSYKLSALRSIRPHRPSAIRFDSLRHRPELRLYEVIDKTYKVFTFDSAGAHLVNRAGFFFGKTVDGTYVDIPEDNVLYAGVNRTDPAASVLASLGIVAVGVAAVALIIAATKQSCPFIYAYDGQQYVFDAEPLGGAICPGLARTDISRLDHAKPVEGEYRLLVRNEVPETQYIDRMTMLLVDHAPGTAVYPDLQGKFYGFKKIHGVRSAFDEKGMSLMKFLSQSDKVMWQTHLPSASRDTMGPVRHEITVTLLKPPGAKKAWLITNIGTSSWGSNMIRKTVEYRGNDAPAWLASLTPASDALTEMNQFLEREEMYHLKTWLKEGSSWTQRGTILGQGPLISEDRVYPIDVSHAAGDSLVLRFNPPRGFWTMDYIGVSYEEPTVMSVSPIDARLAIDQGNRSFADSLRATDNHYYSMPDVGNRANVTFPAPPLADRKVRTVFLETRGYYELHLTKDKPQQLARLYSIALHPGQIVRTAMEEFRAWQAQQMAQQQLHPEAR